MTNVLWPVVILLCISMFFIRREYKLAIMLFSLMILSSVPNTYPGGKFLTLPMCFLISELNIPSRVFTALGKSGVLLIVGLMIVATVVLYIHSPHYHSMEGVARMINKELICKYFYIAYGFICVLNLKSWKIMLNTAFYSMIFLTVLGIFNLVLRHAHFVDIAMQGGVFNDVMAEMGSKFEFQTRFRVQAAFQNPFNYGYICIVNLLLFLYAYAKSLVSKSRFYIVVGCSLFGIVFCGCRTIIVVAAISYIAYVLASQNLSNKVKYVFVILAVSILSYETVTPVRDLVDGTATAFKRNQRVSGGGSSIEMRELQYLTVLYYTKNHMWFGRGKDFFREDLGWKNGKAGRVDGDLYGLEGVLMNRMLERGIVGVTFYLLFNLLVFIVIWRNRAIDKITTSFAVSVLTAYFLFANMTGELYSFPSTFLLIGGAIAILFKQNKEKSMIRIRNIKKHIKTYGAE